MTYRYTPPIQGRISCTLDRATAAPGGTADLTATLENLGSLPGVRGYQTQLVLTRTSGSGTLSVDCPGGITVDDSRPDYLFYGYSEDYPVTNCGLLRASSSLLSGAVVVGSPAYLSGAVLDVSPNAAPGSTFEVTVRLEKQPIPGAPPEPSGLAGLRVLVIDDSKTARCNLTRYLKAPGVRTGSTAAQVGITFSAG